MKTIYKFKLPIRDVAEQYIPKGSKVLSVGMQGDNLCFWAEVDTAEKEFVLRRFRVAGTGYPLECGMKLGRFLGTVFERVFVWHVYEEKDPE